MSEFNEKLIYTTIRNLNKNPDLIIEETITEIEYIYLCYASPDNSNLDSNTWSICRIESYEVDGVKFVIYKWPDGTNKYNYSVTDRHDYNYLIRKFTI